MDMRHAGIHFPNMAEHPSLAAIARLPGCADGVCLMLATEARYHWEEFKAAAPRCTMVWRGLPRPGKLPAQVDWNAKRVADEALNLWDEAEHVGPEWFLPLNELQFDKENGGPFPGYQQAARNLMDLRVELRKRLPGVKLMFPAWVPSDDGDHLSEWQAEAASWDGICLHAYGDADTMRSRYQAYRDAFPGKPILVGEWNANHEGHDERESLKMWADVATDDPWFLGATYFIWETQNDGEQDLSIWRNADRLALFTNPPVGPTPEPVPPPTPEPPMVDPYEHFALEQIISASGCPPESVPLNWPRIVRQLAACNINDRDTQIAAIGTTAIETASTFAPVQEAYWLSEDWRKANLRYYPWFGRGYIQLTWEDNYRSFGQKVDALWNAGGAIDLIARPDDALDPDIAAAVLAVYFRDHGGDGLALIPAAARRGDWTEVRRLVQGGSDGLDRLVAIAGALNAAPEPTPEPVPEPVPMPTPDPTVVELQAQVASLTAERDRLVTTLADVVDRRGDLLVGYAAAIQATVETMRADREHVIGPRPSGA